MVVDGESSYNSEQVLVSLKDDAVDARESCPWGKIRLTDDAETL